VTDLLGNNVTELQASTGNVLNTVSVGLGPMGIVFDGTNVWVANQSGGTVTELSATDGSLLGTFKVGSVPQGIAFDGVDVWVANLVSNSLSKL